MRQVIFANLVTLQAAAPKAARLDPWELILNASVVVTLVMLILAGMSLVCWFVIGAKLVRVTQATKLSEQFLQNFWNAEHGSVWSVRRLEQLYSAHGQQKSAPLAAVFHAGYVELARVLGSGQRASMTQAEQAHFGGDIDNVARSLRRAANNEITRLETMLPFLATTGSTAPFIGLFGTVWGIMNAFMSIGAQKNATLDVVAPGIAEALIATAIGLVAAIPAVMAYNYFLRRIRVLEAEMDAFSSDYLNIVRRHFLAA